MNSIYESIKILSSEIMSAAFFQAALAVGCVGIALYLSRKRSGHKNTKQYTDSDTYGKSVSNKVMNDIVEALEEESPNEENPKKEKREEGAGVIVTKKDEIFVLKYIDNKSKALKIQYPAGKPELIDKDIIETARREFKEEVGIDIPREDLEKAIRYEITGGNNGSSYLFVLKDYEFDHSQIKLEDKFIGWTYATFEKELGNWHGRNDDDCVYPYRTYNTYFFDQHADKLKKLLTN